MKISILTVAARYRNWLRSILADIDARTRKDIKEPTHTAQVPLGVADLQERIDRRNVEAQTFLDQLMRLEATMISRCVVIDRPTRTASVE